MLIAGDGLGNECYAALKIRDNQRSVARGLIFPGPQLTFAIPGPARPQRAVYQRDRTPSGFGCFLQSWPEFGGRLLDQRGEECDDP